MLDAARGPSYPAPMTEWRYRLIDLAGSELGIVTSLVEIGDGDEVTMPDGAAGVVVEVYDDEDGREGGVAATLVVDDDA